VRTHLALYNQNRVLEIKVEEKTRLVNQAMDQLKDGSLETIHRLTQAAEYIDDDTGEHIQRMSKYTAAVAKKMGANNNSIESILRAAPMHDVGKIGIPDRILLKPDKLDADEWKLMKEHTTIGGRILSNSKAGFIRLGEIIALSHHEKWDGSGYPLGLQGKEIPLVGQMVAIADVFDALTTRRPYKEPFSIVSACDIILEGRGTQFNPAIVDAFFAIKNEILDIKRKYKDSKQSHLRKYA
jgi:putative two-component system response regulator